MAKTATKSVKRTKTAKPKAAKAAPQGRIIAVVNQKGGVGKTTTAVNLSACLASLGKSVLVVDIDPQGNSTSGLGIEKAKLSSTIYELIMENLPLKEVITPTLIPELKMVPATLSLSGAEVELTSAISRETRLKNALSSVKSQFQYIIIDCPPSLGLLTINALTAADYLMIPIQCEFYPLEGLTHLIKVVELVKRHLNPDLEILGVLLTMFDPRLNLSQQVAAEIRGYFKNRVFKTVIPRNVKLSEAPSFGKPVLLYDKSCRGTKAYQELAREINKTDFN